MAVNEQFMKEFMNQIDMEIFTPRMYQFFMDFLSIERIRRYNDQYVISTFIPPFPGKAFDRFLDIFKNGDDISGINSVDLALTNACMFNCRHCYNSGRLVSDPSVDMLRDVIRRLQKMGVFVINFTGGDPCLRSDLPEICSAVDDTTSMIISTTGYGFTDDMAKRLRDEGVYAISISLDCADEEEHDRIRGVKGAYKIAMQGIETALKYGFYTYTCMVPNPKNLEQERFSRLIDLNRRLGVYEIQILEPAPAGKLLKSSKLLDVHDYETIINYMKRYNSDQNNPAISSFSHLESPEFFGCGAGFSHLYIDGTGEVSPCNMMPASYGNAYEDGIEKIVAKIQSDLKQPCKTCRVFAQREYFQSGEKNNGLILVSDCNSIPDFNDGLPGFYELLRESSDDKAGVDEIIAGYSVASESYDDYWIKVASGPIDEMFEMIKIPEGSVAVDLGCGTGYTTAKLAIRTGVGGNVTGIDLTENMVRQAKGRINKLGLKSVKLIIENVLTELENINPGSVDIATLTWLIGYVGCDEIFPELFKVLKPGGRIGFVAHLDRSPEIPIDVFEELIRKNPGVMEKTVQMKFPVGDQDTSKFLVNAGFEIEWLKCGEFIVNCKSGKEVFDHVMKSGAGSTFYHSVRKSAREDLTDQFIAEIEKKIGSQTELPIGHRYITGIARRPE